MGPEKRIYDDGRISISVDRGMEDRWRYYNITHWPKREAIASVRYPNEAVMLASLIKHLARLKKHGWG